jgi:hypothetical protein
MAGSDQKPPRLASDELATVRELLQFQRDSFVRKVDGVSDRAARQRFVESDTTLLWLTKHIAWAEQLWFVARFAGEEPELLDDTVRPDDTVAIAVDAYRRTWARVDAIIDAAPNLDVLCQNFPDEPVNLRWVLVHMLEETARHAGHADILRELIDGTTGR